MYIQKRSDPKSQFLMTVEIHQDTLQYVIQNDKEGNAPLFDLQIMIVYVKDSGTKTIQGVNIWMGKDLSNAEDNIHDGMWDIVDKEMLYQFVDRIVVAKFTTYPTSDANEITSQIMHIITYHCQKNQILIREN